jgi:hypothetical protein
LNTDDRKSDGNKALILKGILKRPSSQNPNFHFSSKRQKLHVRFGDETVAGPATTEHYFYTNCNHTDVPRFFQASVPMSFVLLLWNLMLQVMGFGCGLLQGTSMSVIKSIKEPARNPDGHKRAQ